MRKLAAFLLCAALCLSLITIPAAAALADTAATSAAALNMMGALQGDGSGSLNLDGTLTRAQFCKIAVVVLGLTKSVGQYAGYTIFPDVPSSGWASGYVNLAVRSAGIMSGYPDGKFYPDDVITYGQAVTVLMKMLGYQTADVGYNWPDSYLSKADDIGLTAGVSLSANDIVTRGSVAILFVNLMNAETNGSTKKFMETISGATVLPNVFLVSCDATTDSGIKGAVQISGASSGTYLPANNVPGQLRGQYGALVLNAAGKALVMVPETSGKTVVSTVSSASSSAITCADGTKITMNSSASFYLDGTLKTYSDTWADIEGGMFVSAYYSDGGAVQSVLVANGDSAASGSSVSIMGTASLTLPDSATVYINGIAASASDVEKYDVISENGSGLYNITRSQITARCEDAYPDTSSPATIRVLGTDFKVSDDATLGSFKVGDSITLLLNSGDEVAGVVPATELTVANYGLVSAISTSSVSVILTNGATVSGSLISGTVGIAKGDFVSVSTYDTGEIYVSKVSGGLSSYALNLKDNTLGSLSLSKAAKIYECVGESTAIELKRSDIVVNSVDSTHVKFYTTDQTGKVSLILLSDVTGDVYTYGFVKGGSVTTSSGTLSATTPTTSIVNSNGTTTAVTGTTGLGYGTVAGIAWTGSGSLAGYTTLTAIEGVSRQAFEEDSDGKTYVNTSVGRIPVSDSVQAYIEKSELWTTLAKARSYSDSLTVYYDRTPSTGAKVRVIIAK